MHKLGECPMSSHSGLLAYSTLSYRSTIGGCPVPECIEVNWAHIDVCERFHERNLRQQQRSLRFGIPRLPACMVECSPTCMVCLYGRMQPNLSLVLLDIRIDTSNNSYTTTATIPYILYIRGTSETIARILRPYNIRVVHKPIFTLRRLLTNV